MSTQSAPDLPHPQVEHALTGIFLFFKWTNVITNFKFKKDRMCAPPSESDTEQHSDCRRMTGRKDFVLWYLRQFGGKHLRQYGAIIIYNIIIYKKHWAELGCRLADQWVLMKCFTFQNTLPQRRSTIVTVAGGLGKVMGRGTVVNDLSRPMT